MQLFADFSAKVINFEKTIACPKKKGYNSKCCDMIAVKREVAALSSEAGFPWSECLETAQSVKQTDDKSLYKQNGLLESAECSVDSGKQKRRVVKI